jgi:putative transposase
MPTALERRTGDHAMPSVTTKLEATQPPTANASHLFDDWFDPIEVGVRDRVREFIEEMIRGELDAALSRPRYGRQVRTAADGEDTRGIVGHRHGSRMRKLTGTFDETKISQGVMDVEFLAGPDPSPQRPFSR